MKLTPGQEAAGKQVRAALDAGADENSEELKTALDALSKESHIALANSLRDWMAKVGARSWSPDGSGGAILYDATGIEIRKISALQIKQEQENERC